MYGGKIKYQYGDKMIPVRELLLRAFMTGWKVSGSDLTQEEYLTSSINVIESMQLEPESIYCEEGQGLLDDELDHLEDMLRADGVWVYYGVGEENFFLLQWMPDEATAQAKLAQLAQDDPQALSFAVDLTLIPDCEKLG